MELIVGKLLPHIAVAVFFIGTCLRIAEWIRTPVPFHVTLFPAPMNTAGRIRSVISEFFLCKTLYHHDKWLWFQTWFFHLSLAMVLAGHAFGIYYLRGQFTLIGLSVESSRIMSRFLGESTGIIMAVSLGGLLCRRIFLPVVRKLSEPENFFALILIMAITLSGILMYLPAYHVDLPSVRSYIGSLAGFSPVQLPRNKPFAVHFALVNIFLLYFPFSRILHSMGFFVIRTMLVETPPIYPTPSNAVQRSSFATKKIMPDIPVPRKSTAGRGGDAG